MPIAWPTSLRASTAAAMVCLVPRGRERDRGVPGQDVRDRLVVGVEGVRLRAVQTEYADRRRRLVARASAERPARCGRRAR